MSILFVVIEQSDLRKGRQFQTHWSNTFKWLSYDETRNKAFCSICIAAYQKIKIKIPHDGASAERS